MKIEKGCWRSEGGWETQRGSLEGRAAQFVLVFGGRRQMEDAARLGALREKFPGAHVLFSSTAGEISGTEVSEDGLLFTAVALEKTRVACAALAITDPAQSQQRGAELAARLAGPDLVHVFVLSDGSLTNGTELARGLSANLPPGVLVTGGLAGDGDRFEHTVVGLDELPTRGRIAAIAFYGRNFKSSYGSAGGWTPVGPHQLITHAVGNRLLELDDRSALALYKEYLGEEAVGLPGAALRFPLSLSPADGSPTVVRTILSIDEAAQSMTFAGDMPPGSRVRFMRASYEDLLDGAAYAAEQARGFPAELVICVSCVGRRLVLGPRIGEEVELVRVAVGARAAITGFYSYGELAPAGREPGCRLHNQTMTITAFAED